MTGGTGWIAAALTGLAALGGIGTQGAQPQGGPAINVDSVVAELGLAGETQTQVTANLNELNRLLALRGQSSANCGQIHSQIADVFTTIDSVLTPAQQRQLRPALRNAGIMGRMGHAGGPHMNGMAAGGCGGSGMDGAMHRGGGMHRGHGMHQDSSMHGGAPYQMRRGAGR